jgi:hypothetical protein
MIPEMPRERPDMEEIDSMHAVSTSAATDLCIHCFLLI